MLSLASRPLRDQWPYWLLVAAIVLHLAMMGSLFWGYLDTLFYASDRLPHAFDFFAIYEAGQSVLLNRSVYYFSWLGGTRAPYAARYGYVPFFAYAFGVPANALPPWSAYWAWVALNEVLLVANAFVTWRAAGRSSWGVIGAAMWFAYTPVYVELHQGQFSLLMATALLWLGVGLLQKREVLGGVSWAASLVIKSTSALVGPLLLRVGWWRALLIGAAVSAVNIPYFIWRPDDFTIFWHGSVLNNSIDSSTLSNYLYVPVNHGLLAFLDNTILTFQDSVPRRLPAALATLIILPSFAVTFLGKRPDPLLLFAIWTVSFFLFFGWVPEFHYVMLLPVLVLLVTHRPAVRPLVLAVFVVLALPTPYWLLNHVWNTAPAPPGNLLDTLQRTWPKWGVVVYHAWKPVPTLILWAWLVVAQLRTGVSLHACRQMLSTVRQRLRPSASAR
jgi:hypothetical protein